MTIQRHIFYDILDLFSDIRQYVMTTGKQVYFTFGLIHYNWLDTPDIDDNLQVWQIPQEDYPSAKRIANDLKISNVSKHEAIMIKLLQNKEFDMITQYLNHGDRILNLLVFL